MQFIADLHIHSKYSRSCSKDLDLEHIEQWCKRKGISIVGTADFTHPQWFHELVTKLEEQEKGLYKLRGTDGVVHFMLTSEISCIYKQNDKARRIHLCIFAPSIATVAKINNILTKNGFNLKSDGRPIIGMSAKNLTKLLLDIDSKIMIVPAHVWTPWFAVFGSKSGFNSLEECFEELTPYIYAIETGLSSDPAMNWQWSKLDNITLLSNSDAHSPANLGREANIFDIEPAKLSYEEVYRIIKEKDNQRFLYTIEFFPEEGKYHYDGHASCNYSSHPQESKKNKNLCPVCKKELVLGVMHRANDLSDRKNASGDNFIPFKSAIPLAEIIANVLQVGKNSKKVQAEYFNMIKKHSEFDILLHISGNALEKITSTKIAEAIINVRDKKVTVTPGYDGIYGTINIVNHKKMIQNNLL